MNVKYPAIGVCGLSCRLCPRYASEGKSRCTGCKTESRMGAGCSFITCAIRRKGIEFCWDCQENETCDKWKMHRDAGKQMDSFKSYQTLEDDIRFVTENGVEAFEKMQVAREEMLREMLEQFNEGRSKSMYCIAASVFGIDELREVLDQATASSAGLDTRGKALLLRSKLQEMAKARNITLGLRKP
ncbi:MAG: DUF3795 domain-containing protein [Clostridia bacterium]